jgi:hypothetical protein
LHTLNIASFGNWKMIREPPDPPRAREGHMHSAMAGRYEGGRHGDSARATPSCIRGCHKSKIQRDVVRKE